jgi:pimeloyl-ACP methyl ester carboxylesterase
MLPSYSVVAGDAPRAWMLVLHGIYGSGANWRTFARKLVERRPEWGCALVDLRMHGASQDAPPPHTVAAAAADLAAIPLEVRAVCGHSFGGKVTLEYVRSHDVLQAWVLDASPSARPNAWSEPDNSVADVLRFIEDLPARFPSRAAFVARAEALGHHQMLANWLAMNLDPVGDEYVFRLDPAALRALLTDYYAVDSWDVVEQHASVLRFVAAGRSSSVSPEDRARIVALGAGLDVLENASHWLHIDSLPALLDLVADGLPAV